MLKRFKVPEKDEVRIPHESLLETVAAVFERMGTSPEDAAEGADVLVMTDLRGVETHGVSNMLRIYVSDYNNGRLNPRPNWQVVKETPGTATIDADSGLGIMLGRAAMDMAIDKARNVGVGVVTMGNSGHLGAVGHFAVMAAEADMIGVCMTAGGANVLPTFGAEARLGANPISMAAPAGEEAPVLFDAATSAIAGNKIRLAARVGVNLLPGWVADNDGTPVMEEAAYGGSERPLQLPLGGTRDMGSHKGYGFAMMAEVLCTMLAGGLPAMLQDDPTRYVFRNFFAAYNISAFIDVDEFKDHMDQTLRALRTTEPAPGHDRVVYAGMPEHEDERDRRANGIPLHREVVQWFDEAAEELAVPRLRRM